MGELVADAIGRTMEKFDLFANMTHFRVPNGWVTRSLLLACYISASGICFERGEKWPGETGDRENKDAVTESGSCPGGSRLTPILLPRF